MYSHAAYADAQTHRHAPTTGHWQGCGKYGKEQGEYFAAGGGNTLRLAMLSPGPSSTMMRFRKLFESISFRSD